MTENMTRKIARAKELARKGDQKAAVSLANELAAEHPSEMEVWLLRSYLYERTGDYPNACADLTRAIEIDDAEPHLFFSRGTYRFALGEDQSAIEDFSKGLILCDRLKNDYYRETLHFWRAETLLRLGRKREALLDLAQVHDGFRFWTYKLRSKEDLLADCDLLE